ncbi:glycosyltransferase family 39 protein [Alphaproteobacteria bacterium]|nr:glycosyltransferase family 39 protein [Alphaproteobacteria bacterium]
MTNRVIIFSLLILVLFKVISVYLTEFTLYGDEAQYWLWSQSPDLGYFSKPPLLAWFIYGYESVFGSSFFSLKMFPIIIYFFISLATYKLCLLLFLSKNKSFLCAISFFIIPAASLSSFLISTDLLLLLFWILTMIKILETRVNGSIANFFLFGLFLGLMFLAKYAAVYFLINLVLLIIMDKKTFYVFKMNPVGVIVFLISLLVVLIPNVYWNLNNGWVTFSHTSSNANLNNLNLNFYEPIKFISSQILMVGPILFFSFIFLLKHLNLDFENKFLLIFSIPIIFIVLVESFLVRANANWAAPALISVFILFFKIVSDNKMFLIKINFIFNYVIAVILFSFILTSSKHKIFDRIRGIDVFVKEISEIINDKDLVISDRIIFSNTSYELRDKPNRLYMAYDNNMRITNHFQINSNLMANRKSDFYLIGELSDISYLLKKNKGSLVKEFVVPFNSSNLKLYEINFK